MADLITEPIPHTEAADAIRQQDADKPLEARRVIEGEALKQVEQGRLVRGPNQIFDLRTPREKGKLGGFEWSPGELRLPLETLPQRYDPEVWVQFTTWSKSQGISPTGMTVWDWLSADPVWALLDKRQVPPDEAAAILRSAPNHHPVVHPVVQALSIWGNDQEVFAKFIPDGSPEAQQWRAIIAAVIDCLAPVADRPTVFRGSRDQAVLGQFLGKVWAQPRVGLSTSLSQNIAAGKFLGPAGIRSGMSAARLISPLSFAHLILYSPMSKSSFSPILPCLN